MDLLRFAEVTGTRLAYQDSGAGVPVVLIHGFTLDHRMWDDQVRALEPLARVIRYDLRGYGHSDLPGPEAYSSAEDLHALLQHLHAERAVIIGFSVGGGVALRFALAYPDTVCALVLIGPTVDGWAWNATFSAELERINALGREESVEAAREAWLAHALFLPALEQPDVAARLRTIVTDYSGFHFTHHAPEEWPDPPALERLGEIRCPSVVIVGERDVHELRAIAGTLAERIAGAQLVVIPGAGHMANMEAPQLVNEAVVRFLSQVLQAGGSQENAPSPTQ